MAAHYSRKRKIRPLRGAARRPDGTPGDDDRVEIGPTALAFAEWADAGLQAPDLERMRTFRLERLVHGLQERDYAGIVLFDPLNIRYATDTTNMQVWAAHNPFRACFVSASGYVVLWDFQPGGLLTGFNPLVRETRAGASFFYMVSGDRVDEDARRFAAEVEALVVEHAGRNRRLALDRIEIAGLRALQGLGFDLRDGEEVMEKVRSVKGAEELKAMRCALHACERALDAMHQAVRPGLSEAEVWSVLHAENIRRGGEWIETRLLASGPRTNPWFQECGPRVIGGGELLAFDTDLVGCYGMCADISRTWLVGDGEPSAAQRRLFREALEQLRENTATIAPGKSMREIALGGRPLPPEYRVRRYSVKMHGVGLCDEWPSIYYPEDFREGAFDYRLEPGMVLCVEAYIGEDGGREGVKLEDQVLVTEDGHENLTRYPFDERLIG